MNDDAELLRHYVATRSGDAFTQLVQRHIGLVHATARRRVGGDAHLADDVTQTVFIALARKAPSLRDRTSLAGWLYLSTQHAAAEVVRREQRRKAREAAAQSMQLADTPDQADADLARLRPLLDDAIVKLKGDEREAIVLRFFEQRSFPEIGTALQVSEEAARKRVDRSLEKLHAILVRGGITSSVAALGITLTAAGTGTVPAGLAAQVAGVAVTQAAAGGAAGFTASSVASALLPAAAAAALVFGAMTILPQHRANAASAAEIARLELPDAALEQLRAENHRLARAVALGDVRANVAVASAPVSVAAPARPPAGPAPASKSLTITTEGVIEWEGRRITLDEFLAQLSAHQAAAPNGESQLVVTANGVHFRQLAYVLDEARKARIRHLVVVSDAIPDGHEPNPWAWF